jgi:glycolate dehydrogenase FAD-binding subunit
VWRGISARPATRAPGHLGLNVTAVSSPAVADAFAEVVGREHLTSDGPALARHAVDGVTPRWVARPASAGEVSRLIAIASAESLAVTPRGSGSALALGNPPRRLDLVLDLSRLSAVTDYVPEDMVASVEAGAPLSALARHFTARGQMLALDPIGGAGRSIGGILASAASGPLRFRYGTGRDLLLGVRFVQADGTITWGGSRVVKSVTGYDVPKLIVGSLGTLGVLVGATLRLHPLPPARESWLYAPPSLESAGAFLAALLDSSLEPDRVMLLNGQAARALGRSAGGPVVLVSVGTVPEAVLGQGEALARLAHAHGAGVEGISEERWDALGEALTGPVALRLSSEPKRLVFWVDELERLTGRLGLRASIVAEAGSGVQEVALRGEIPGPSLSRDLIQPLRDGLGPEGGSLVVARASSELKAGLDVWGPIDPGSFDLMSRIKTEFDPRGILNPGRFVGGL